MSRPTKYNKDYPNELLDLMSKGMLDYQVYAKWDIDHSTFYMWLNKYPDLKDAHNKGKVKIEALLTERLKEMAMTGIDKGFKPMIALLNNKCGWGVDGEKKSVTTNINVQGNLQVLQTKSPQELIETVQNNLEFLKNNNVIDVEFTKVENDSESDQ